ncbi:MAG: hypothetical protein Q4D13_05215 [Erysipelotrichaceae bacterium]|nr:hypothetical protein [Erysipelotrichaceae bacterium]
MHKAFSFTSSSGSFRSGINIEGILALYEASIPALASSKTRHSFLSKPKTSAALLNTSGSGLPLLTHSAVIRASNLS